MTRWEPEYVCEREVDIQREIVISNLYGRLMEEQFRGNLVIHPFEDSMPYKKMISEHVAGRLIRFHALQVLETDPRFQKYYGKIILALQLVMDGHLLS